MATNYISRLSLAMIITLSGCSLFQPKDEIVQNILFEANHISSGWGAPYNGYYIDSDGGLYRFQYELEDEPWKPESFKRMTEKELLEKYAHNQTSLGTINADTLSRMLRLIDNAVQGPYTHTDGVIISEDMGIKTFLAYRFEAETEAYIPVVLWALGSVGVKNLSEAAVELTQWLAPLMGGSSYP